MAANCVFVVVYSVSGVKSLYNSVSKSVHDTLTTNIPITANTIFNFIVFFIINCFIS